MRKFLLATALLVAAVGAQEPSPFLDAYLRKARDLRAAGKTEEARLAV